MIRILLGLILVFNFGYAQDSHVENALEYFVEHYEKEVISREEGKASEGEVIEDIEIQLQQ